MGVLSVALDLGSTRIKAARLEDGAVLSEPVSVPAPPLRGAGEIREGDAAAYLAAAEDALAGARQGLPEEVALGIASQRSSFLLWDRVSGEPATPLVSWQDRRAAEWCRRRRDLGPRIVRRTGLVLSPHYAGPKLASMLEADGALRRRVADGQLVLGTLETWLVWNWSGTRAHRTDPTMAARTLLFDLEMGGWSEELLDVFGVSASALPAIEPSRGRPLALPGRGVLRATLADQAAGVVAVAGEDDGVALVNLGTGTFVLRPTRARGTGSPGYLTGPALVRPDAPTLWALEGTINGGAAAAEPHARTTPLPAADPSPDAFCLPDTTGVGAPYWRAHVPLTFSESAARLPDDERRRVVLEGLVFRVCGILGDLFPDAPPHAILLSGGLANDPFLATALAACLGRDVTVLDEREGTLLGAARLAAGLEGAADCPAHDVSPGSPGTYLNEKFVRWKEWIRSVLTG